MAKLYVQTLPPPDLNKNTEWFMYPGVWTTYIFILFFSWLLVLSFFGCSTDMAWTVVNLFHFAELGKSMKLISLLEISDDTLAPLQPDGAQCGYFILRYMRDVIEGVASIDKASLRPIFAKVVRATKEIDEVRSEWVDCIQDHIF